jgi:hypothetical protein
MEHRRPLFLLLFLIVFLWGHGGAEACTVCHSKKPKMVRMHEALGYKDCFLCHGPTAKKSEDPPEKQMTNDERCIGCHINSSVLSVQPKSSL